MLIRLVDMKPGEAGIVKSVDAGHHADSRIRNIGIRVGKKIKKIETHSLRGPQALLVDKLKIAIGYGMAEKIFIEVERSGGK